MPSPASAPVQHAFTREIWSDADAVLLVFGGAAAEFAVNRAVDWLFFTGALPADPIGRLFRTVRYAQGVALGGAAAARRTLEQIRRIHTGVEQARGAQIPPWAHRAVLYMLIHYTERAGELLGHRLDGSAREGLYADFRRIGEELEMADLPTDYASWRHDRARSLADVLAWSPSSAALYAAYRRRLGPWRYELLRRLQGVLVPPPVRRMLRLPDPAVGMGLMAGIRVLRTLRLTPAARRVVIPRRHWEALDSLAAARSSLA